MQALHTQLHEIYIIFNVLYNAGSLIVVLIQYGVSGLLKMYLCIAVN